MTKNHNTRKALLFSLLSLMLCVTLLIGFTLAWFTDSVYNNNRIISGNLDIGLQGKIDGEYKDLSSDPLFDADIKWEPGQMYYWDLKVQNLGTLAAKFSVNVAEWVGNYVLEANNDGTYSATERTLLDVIRMASFEGSFEDLVDAVNESQGTNYTTADRDVVKEAIELDLFVKNDILCDTDPNFGSLFEGTLEAKEEAEFTLVAYWAYEVSDDDYFYEGNDNDYNLINGLAASKFTTTDVEDFDGDDYDAFMAQDFTEDNLNSDGLYMTFDIVVFATQAPSEKDGFVEVDAEGNDSNFYDDDIKFNSSLLPPEVGQG